MTASVSFTDTDALTALRTVLIDLLGIEVIRAQTNRVPEPLEDAFIIMTPMLRTRLSAIETYPQIPHATTVEAMQPTRLDIQLDIHGAEAGDHAQILSTVLNGRIGCDAFAAIGPDVTPLYVSDPHQSPFINGEQQYEYRWTMDVSLQINPVVSVPQDYADAVTVGIINVDAVYPP